MSLRVRPVGVPTKILLSALLVGLADFLFWDHDVPSALGRFALGAWAALVLVQPAVRRDRRALAALAIAVSAALLLLDRPSAIAWLVFCIAMGVAALSPRAPAQQDAWCWLQRLAAAAVLGWKQPVDDALRLADRRLVRRRGGAVFQAAVLIVPAVGGAVFLLLFAAANPLIGQAFEHLSFPAVEPPRVVIWTMVGISAWILLRPRSLRRTLPLPAASPRSRLAPASVVLSLLVFNLLFALQNGLDLFFLWSGAPLPVGVTLADYAHRGAYLLIVTVLLAAAFVLVALDPASELARRRSVRRLVVAFLAQNLLLVASSMLRTLDYVEAYALTQFRLAALVWMVLVAIGLALTGVRLVKGRSSAWLVNASVAAAGVLLMLVAAVDLGAVAAHWNVGHAREAGGRGASLDLCYLDRLGAAALLPTIALEQRTADPELRDRLAYVRERTLTDLEERQADWRTWTFRGQRRLASARAQLGTLAPPKPGLRDCHARLPPAAITAKPPLTSPVQPGT